MYLCGLLTGFRLDMGDFNICKKKAANPDVRGHLWKFSVQESDKNM